MTQSSSEGIPAVATTHLPTFGLLFSNSWRWLWSDVNKFIILAFLVALATTIAGAVQFFGAQLVDLDDMFGTPTILFALLMYATMVISYIVYTWIALMIAAKPNNSHISAITLTKRLFVPFAVVIVTATILIMLGMIALIVPGVVLALYLTPVMWVVLCEDVTGKLALQRSIDLVQGRALYIAKQLLFMFLCFVPLIVILITIGGYAFFAIISGVEINPYIFYPSLLVLYGLFIIVPTLLYLRFSYELYQGLCATYLPVTKRFWWQGSLFTVMYPLAFALGILYILAAPWLTILDIRNSATEFPLPTDYSEDSLYDYESGEYFDESVMDEASFESVTSELPYVEDAYYTEEQVPTATVETTY